MNKFLLLLPLGVVSAIGVGLGVWFGGGNETPNTSSTSDSIGTETTASSTSSSHLSPPTTTASSTEFSNGCPEGVSGMWFIGTHLYTCGVKSPKSPPL